MHNPAPIPDDLDINTWLRPRDALNLLHPIFGSDVEGAIQWIVERLRADRILAIARNARMGGRDYTRLFMPGSYWKDWAYLAQGVMTFWNGGDVTLWRAGTTEIGRFFDVRFEPDAFVQIAPTPVSDQFIQSPNSPQPPDASNQSIRRGAPTKDYWEPMLIAMFDGLWHGTLTPERQSDLEASMAAWLAKDNHFPSEQSIRSRARNLWKAYRKEDN